jgi:hypothetical protein
MHKDKMGDNEDEKEGRPTNHFMFWNQRLYTISHSLQPHVKKKPPFALRCLVQECMSEIIAMDIGVIINKNK